MFCLGTMNGNPRVRPVDVVPRESLGFARNSHPSPAGKRQQQSPFGVGQLVHDLGGSLGRNKRFLLALGKRSRNSFGLEWIAGNEFQSQGLFKELAGTRAAFSNRGFFQLASPLDSLVRTSFQVVPPLDIPSLGDFLKRCIWLEELQQQSFALVPGNERIGLYGRAVFLEIVLQNLGERHHNTSPGTGY